MGLVAVGNIHGRVMEPALADLVQVSGDVFQQLTVAKSGIVLNGLTHLGRILRLQIHPHPGCGGISRPGLVGPDGLGINGPSKALLASRVGPHVAVCRPLKSILKVIDDHQRTGRRLIGHFWEGLGGPSPVSGAGRIEIKRGEDSGHWPILVPVCCPRVDEVLNTWQQIWRPTGLLGRREN